LKPLRTKADLRRLGRNNSRHFQSHGKLIHVAPNPSTTGLAKAIGWGWLSGEAHVTNSILSQAEEIARARREARETEFDSALDAAVDRLIERRHVARWALRELLAALEAGKVSRYEAALILDAFGDGELRDEVSEGLRLEIIDAALNLRKDN